MPARMKVVRPQRPNIAYVTDTTKLPFYLGKHANVHISDLESFVSQPFSERGLTELTSSSRSKLAAGILGGLEQIYMKPANKVT